MRNNYPWWEDNTCLETWRLWQTGINFSHHAPTNKTFWFFSRTRFDLYWNNLSLSKCILFAQFPAYNDCCPAIPVFIFLVGKVYIHLLSGGGTNLHVSTEAIFCGSVSLHFDAAYFNALGTLIRNFVFLSSGILCITHDIFSAIFSICLLHFTQFPFLVKFWALL